ncbi:MAG: S8 family peptidase [Muribaculaceae bacterium]|nr:S8 family peptidase [Muribaculaceae bacterium]
MRKISYFISALLLAGSLSMSAENKLDASLNNFMRKSPAYAGKTIKNLGSNDGSDQNRAAVLITLAPGSTSEDLKENGIEISEVYGNIAVAYVTASDLRLMQQMDCVSRVQRSRKKRLLNNTARSATSVDKIHQGTELSQSFTGDGVIVGVVDGGFDPNHIMFKDADGNMRVKKFWNYTVNDRTGKITTNTYTGSSLTSFTTDDNSATHATHVTGIAAGAYNFGKTGTQYYGMAPEADILMAGGDLTDDVILSGAKAMIDYAKGEGKPLVINMSLGDNIGPHDGSDAFTSALNELAKDNTICLAAGNEADLNIVVKKTLTSSDKTVRTTIIPTSDLLAEDRKFQAYCDVEVWASDNREFSVKFAMVNKSTGSVVYSLDGTTSMKYVSSGNMRESGDAQNTQFTNAYPDSYAGLQKGLSSANNRYYAEMTFYLINKSATSKTYLPAIIVEGQPGQTIWIYNDAYYTEFSKSGLSGYDDITTDGTISNMACGKNTIAVGAYSTRSSSWAANGKIAPFSSWGNLADGRSLPHVSAPGVDMISAMSTPYYNSSNYSSLYDPVSYTATVSGKKYTWTQMSGTSMATPVMTGVSALWLQADPQLTPHQICDIAKSTAQPADNTVQWGAGKLDAYEGIKKVLGMSSVVSVIDREEEILMIKSLDNNIYEVYMPGCGNLSVTLYNMSGSAVASSEGSDEVIISAEGLAAGIYLLRATDGSNCATRKIIVR